MKRKRRANAVTAEASNGYDKLERLRFVPNAGRLVPYVRHPMPSGAPGQIARGCSRSRSSLAHARDRRPDGRRPTRHVNAEWSNFRPVLVRSVDLSKTLQMK
jgi:hypothetical protein